MQATGAPESAVERHLRSLAGLVPEPLSSPCTAHQCRPERGIWGGAITPPYRTDRLFNQIPAMARSYLPYSTRQAD